MEIELMTTATTSTTSSALARRFLAPMALVLTSTLAFSSAAFADGPLWTTKENRIPKVALPSLSPVIQDVAPAVLTITTEVGERQTNTRIPFGPFSFRVPNQGPQKGQGSGFLIHPAGYALTNFHVVENAEKIFVNVSDDKSQIPATVVGTDPKTDVALIKLESDRNDWPVIPFGDSSSMNVGDFVVAIGNPFGLTMSVSTGIISARSRRDIRPSGRSGLYDFLQTDASINPGNSGGPLVNLMGEVIGINSATNMQGDGIGFAIPINLVKRLIPDLKNDGKVQRSWIGIGLGRVTSDTYQGYGLERPRGALVKQVIKASPAEKAGLEPGDVITKFDGKLLKDASDLPLLAGHAGVGKEVKLEVLRNKRRKTFRLKLAALPTVDQEGNISPAAKRPVVEQSDLGVRVQTLTNKTRRELGLGSNVKGALIVDLRPGGKAQEAGLVEGDVIIKVNGTPVRSTKGLTDALKKTRRGQLVKILVNRKGDIIFGAVVLN